MGWHRGLVDTECKTEHAQPAAPIDVDGTARQIVLDDIPPPSVTRARAAPPSRRRPLYAALAVLGILTVGF